MMQGTYLANLPVHWYNKFRMESKNDVQDDVLSGFPLEAAIESNIDQVRGIIEEDPHF